MEIAERKKIARPTMVQIQINSRSKNSLKRTNIFYRPVFPQGWNDLKVQH